MIFRFRRSERFAADVQGHPGADVERGSGSVRVGRVQPVPGARGEQLVVEPAKSVERGEFRPLAEPVELSESAVGNGRR